MLYVSERNADGWIVRDTDSLSEKFFTSDELHKFVGKIDGVQSDDGFVYTKISDDIFSEIDLKDRLLRGYGYKTSNGVLKRLIVVSNADIRLSDFCTELADYSVYKTDKSVLRLIFDDKITNVLYRAFDGLRFIWNNAVNNVTVDISDVENYMLLLKIYRAISEVITINLQTGQVVDDKGRHRLMTLTFFMFSDMRMYSDSGAPSDVRSFVHEHFAPIVIEFIPGTLEINMELVDDILLSRQTWVSEKRSFSAMNGFIEKPNALYFRGFMESAKYFLQMFGLKLYQYNMLFKTAVTCEDLDVQDRLIAFASKVRDRLIELDKAGYFKDRVRQLNA